MFACSIHLESFRAQETGAVLPINYSLEQWLGWGRWLQQLSVATDAKAALTDMVTWGYDLDYEAPGEARLVGRLQIAMGEMAKALAKKSIGIEDIDVDAECRPSGLHV